MTENTITPGSSQAVPETDEAHSRQNQAEFQDSVLTGITALGPLKAPTTTWSEEEQKQPVRRQKWARSLKFVAFGFIMFLFFLYTTFPYGVVKEVIVDRITQEIQSSGLPIRVSIESLEPYWMIGFEMENISIRNVTFPSATLTLGRARVTVNPFALLIGRVSTSLYVTQAGGSMSLGVSLPISTLLSGAPSPRAASVELRSFSLDPLFNHALAFAASSKDPGMLLVAPLIAKTTIGGKLSGRIDFSNASPEHFGNAKGLFELSVEDGFLHIADDTLKIRKQSFQTANIDLGFENAALVLGKGTNFAAEDIEVQLDGKVILPDINKQPAQVNINLMLVMREKIMDTLGFIVPNMLRCPPMNNGSLKVNLNGPVSNMTCTGT